jgi:formylglycine-generating enzyme required for sulfatase activity
VVDQHLARSLIWQRAFPVKNTNDDGFLATSPVGSFPENGYELFDMSGNVWEWCHDNYAAEYYGDSPKRNPQGAEESLEPDFQTRIQRGGSIICCVTYCTGYRVTARMKGEQGSGLYHTDFRCVVSYDGLDAFRTARAQKE